MFNKFITLALSRAEPMAKETSEKIEKVIDAVTGVIPDSFANAGESLDSAVTKAATAVKTFVQKVS